MCKITQCRRGEVRERWRGVMRDHVVSAILRDRMANAILLVWGWGRDAWIWNWGRQDGGSHHVAGAILGLNQWGR